MKLLLASQSPRRKELLQCLGFPFEVVSIHCDESYPSQLPICEVAAYLSLKKANSYTHLRSGEILLTADTIVSCSGQILGKPRDKQEAAQMLKKLSGNTHEVYTGITLKTSTKTTTLTDKAEVEFMPISSEENDFYINEFKPLDKAGSYGIQDWIGMAKINKISGSYYTIMGLPTHLIYKELNKLTK